MSEFDLRALLAALHEREVRFVVIGGVVQRLRGVPAYSELAGDAVESNVLGIPVRVCSLGRLREMKRVQNRAQDQADLENLPQG